MRELNAALRQSAASGCRVLVVSSALPESFSAGVDVRDHVASRLDDMLAEVRENARLLFTIEAVTIAAVHGPALGGGAELALLCDLLIASDDATLRLPEIGLAAFPPVAAALLPERCAWSLAMRLLTGEPITAEAARQGGLIADVVPRPGLHATVEGRATQLAGNSGVALRALVKATRVERATALLARLDAAIGIYKSLIGPSRDAQEGIDAFLQKRAPAWSHR